jgi:hypothetical protein
LVKHTKTGKINQTTIKYTKWPQNVPNVSKIDQHLPLQVTPKFPQIVIFWFENMPSGNPAPEWPQGRPLAAASGQRLRPVSGGPRQNFDEDSRPTQKIAGFVFLSRVLLFKNFAYMMRNHLQSFNCLVTC